MKIKYNEFVHEVADQVRETLGLQYEVTVERVVKNNARDYYGLIIRDQMSEDDKYMAPAIYLDPWYEEYRKGSELDVITEEVIRVYQEIGRAHV